MAFCDGISTIISNSLQVVNQLFFARFLTVENSEFKHHRCFIRVDIYKLVKISPWLQTVLFSHCLALKLGKRHQDINCIHQVTSDKSSAGQKWTIAQSVLWRALTVVNHNNIYPDLIVSTSNVSPRVPFRGNVDVLTLGIRALRRLWVQTVELTFCGSVSSNQCCGAIASIDGALTSVVTWPLAVLSCQFQNVRWLKAPDSFNMCPVHPEQITLQAHNTVLMCKLSEDWECFLMC